MTKIAVAKAEVIGPDPQYSGLLHVDLRLNDRPSQSWGECFERGFRTTGWPVSMRRPKLDTGMGIVRLEVPDDDVKRAAEIVAGIIEAANKIYEDEVIPSLKRRAEQEERKKQELDKRVTDAQGELDDLF